MEQAPQELHRTWKLVIGLAVLLPVVALVALALYLMGSVPASMTGLVVVALFAAGWRYRKAGQRLDTALNRVETASPRRRTADLTSLHV